MSAPPIPPRPYEISSSGNQSRTNGGPPPLPPLPPDLRIQAEKYVTPSRYELESPPHFQTPLIAPRPHRVDKSIPMNMARTLDEQMYTNPPPINYAPGFVIPGQQRQQQQQQQYQQQPQGGWQTAPITQVDLATSIANLSIQPSTSFPLNPQPNTNMSVPPPPAAAPTAVASSSSSSAQASSSSSSPPSLTAPLPQLTQLNAAAEQVQLPTHDPALKVAWCRDVFFLLDRAQGNPTDPIIGPVSITDPVLARLAHIAVPVVLQLATSWTPSQAQQGKMPPHVAEAIYLRATLAATGAFPEHVRHNPRTAFRDFEAAARGGYPAAWFRLGRDYENFNDNTRAKDCFERGAKLNVESCLYRLGMAHLLGQLSLPSNPPLALPLLHRAALLASLTTPQPAYVFALLLLSEFTQITLPPTLFAPFIPPSSSPSSYSSPTLEARKHLERAAYLHFPAAQYKLGHAYEFAEPPFAFDPLLSVQYYSLASQQGEVEADMALSKWFLCGSGGAALASQGQSGMKGEGGGFEKDEALALTFAEKAARKGLPSAEFAMGYYAEVGVGQPRSIPTAIAWYTKASSHGNEDASARLQALTVAGPDAVGLSRKEHDTITEQKLVRRRTQAAQRAETQPLSPPWEGRVFPSAREWEDGVGAGGQGGGQGQMQQQQEYAQVGQQQRQYSQQQQGQQQQPAGRRRQPQDPRMVVDVIRKNSLAAGYAPLSVSSSGPGSSTPGYDPGPSGGGGMLQAGIRGESPQRMGRRGESPQRIGGPRGRYDSTSGSGAGTRTPPQQQYPQQQQSQQYPQQPQQQQQYQSSQQQQQQQYPQNPQRMESPSRRTQSPSRRAQSPGRLGRLPISGPASTSASSGIGSSPSMTQSHSHSNSIGGSPGRLGGGGGMEGQPQGRSKLERMRLNLDDPPNSNAFPPSSASFPSSSSTPGVNGSSNANAKYGGGGGDTPLPTTMAALATPGGIGAAPTPTTARPGGGKAQTFADLGIQGAKVEDKDCVIM